MKRSVETNGSLCSFQMIAVALFSLAKAITSIIHDKYTALLNQQSSSQMANLDSDHFSIEDARDSYLF